MSIQNKLKSIVSFLPVALMAVIASAGCSNSNDSIVIRVLNTADYIYEGCTEEEYKEDPELDKRHMMQQFTDYMEEKNPGKKYKYVYDTYDTPENLFNAMMTGKSTYDIVNTSDYMVQKLISYDLIQTLSFDKEKYVDNDYTLSIRDNISDFLWDKFDNIYPKDVKNNERMRDKPLSNYSVPYMWGTVGILFNPYFSNYVNQGFDVDEVVEKFQTWDVLYSDFAHNSFSIKDSVRDVYAVSIVHTMYEDKVKPLEVQLENGEITENEFNSKFTEIFNMCDDETLKIIKDDLNKLKENSFGFEVDSGKTDMVQGKIGANLAWSGDATWAITEAEESEKELYFATPEEGTNIWFDAWCVPTNGNLELALEFIDFMSSPDQAVQNMDYVGYTSATSDEVLLDYVYWCYDVRGEIGGEVPEGLVEGVDYQLYDLSYFYEDSCDYEDTILYADMAYIDRQLTAQFPTKEKLPHLCIMDDYGKQYSAVLGMWETVRTNPLPLWAIIILVLEVALALTFVGFLIFKNVRGKKIRKARREAKQKRSC